MFAHSYQHMKRFTVLTFLSRGTNRPFFFFVSLLENLSDSFLSPAGLSKNLPLGPAASVICLDPVRQ